MSTPREFEAIRSIAAKLGIGSSEALRKWVRAESSIAGDLLFALDET